MFSDVIAASPWLVAVDFASRGGVFPPRALAPYPIDMLRLVLATSACGSTPDR